MVSIIAKSLTNSLASFSAVFSVLPAVLSCALDEPDALEVVLFDDPTEDEAHAVLTDKFSC